MDNMEDIYILGIESSCDDTSAAVLRNGVLLSNVTASQAVHEAYGGVVPELASRAHQQNVVPVVDQAIKRAGIDKHQLSAIAFTRGPGLMGSLLVGVSFAKGFARALGIPLIDVNHLQGHVMAHFIKESDDDQSAPPFPFLCLLVSGGNSQIVKVNAYNDMQVLGQTIDDAAGEAIDKCSKVMGLGYPGGPIIDKLARKGNPKAYHFAEPHIPGMDYSFSGLKTSFLYSLRDWVKD
ncbi:MAG: tRNA (adenosine(37)-N6)-threonylcarbamoyltransferase complex transferase subunit TsaD, partial [Prevotella sp.]|nr:tRNA (adenosine(37)-N6)-threonylcarbamoyltransferase complex transferase subunit TsaD [Prevotella sp.]